MQAPVAEQRTLLQMQAHDSAIDRLVHRRGSLPEDARLAELGQALAAVDQLAAEREGSLATVRREQARFEDEIEMVTRKARSEDARAVSGKVTRARDAALVEIDRELESERAAREALAPTVGEDLRTLYDQLRSRQGGVGVAALLGNTCQGCRVSISPVELAAVRRQPAEQVKRCENCRRILVVD